MHPSGQAIQGGDITCKVWDFNPPGRSWDPTARCSIAVHVQGERGLPLLLLCPGQSFIC